MTNQTNNQPLNDAQLDQLFAQAANAEIKLMDDNFTKTVMNQLPSRPAAVPTKFKPRRYLPEFLGAFIGIVITFLVIEPGDLLGKVMATLLNNSLISPMDIVLVIGGLAALAYAAWWNMERNPNVWDF